MRLLDSRALSAGAFCILTTAFGPAAPSSRTAAIAAIDTALARMGSMDSLTRIERVRFDTVTQWQRTTFDARPYRDQPSYEQHTDLRDYTIDAWRNTRRFGFNASARSFVDVVRDTVAIRRSEGGSGGVASAAVVAAGKWTTLNEAYVQEKNELLAIAPERLLLGARNASDLRPLADTTIAGAHHARVTAMVNGYRMTIFLHRSSGYLTATRFRTAEESDYGLTPWGTMDVEFWYSGWRKSANGLVYPSQFDVRRVGQPYKRMTILSAVWNPPATPDSFAVSDSLRLAHVANSRRPMHDVSYDSTTLLRERFVTFNAAGAPAGAVKIGSAWLLLEAGQAPLSAQRAVEHLAAIQNGGAAAATIVTTPATGNGGVAWLTSHGITVHVAPGAAPFINAVLSGHETHGTKPRIEPTPRWIRLGGDSLWVEPIDFADAPGAMVVYVPSLDWVYSGVAAHPVKLDRVCALVRPRGWQAAPVRTSRSIVGPL